MLRVGLTGSVAAGKSEVAKRLSNYGIPVFDADAAVHAMYDPCGEAVDAIAKLFPDVVDERGGIDRRRLAEHVLNDPAELLRLEAIVHPLVRARREAFFARAASAGAPYAVAEIPLLFETADIRDFDVIVTVTAPQERRRRRALRRPGMTPDRFAAMEARHLPQEAKTARADIVIVNDGTISDLERKIRNLHARLLAEAQRRERS